MRKLAPSILASDFSRLGDMLGQIEKAGAHYAHIDVMDGCFVPNITLGPPVIKSLRPVSKLVFDVHLMIERPERYIKDFAEAGADIICFHVEAAENPGDTIKKIKELGVKAAAAIKPNTPADSVLPFIEQLDMVLIMSVEPGYGGQALMTHTLDKARSLREYIETHGLSCDIEMDGGIKLSNLGAVLAAGVNVIVAGTDVFKAEDIKKRVGEYLEKIELR
jgi:ribulose-phosphate 3-epimerase